MKKYTKNKIKNNEKGIVLIALIAIIVLILSLAFTVIYFVFYRKEGKVEVEEKNPEVEVIISDQKLETMKNLAMDNKIVSDLTDENVPIPNGFAYKQGNKETGIIIQCIVTGVEYLFIPYNEKADTKVEKYFEKVEDYTMTSKYFDSIIKYGGFYITLNTNIKIDDLKTINQSNYEFQFEQLKSTYSNNESINAHLLYINEIAQIEYYLKNSNVNLGENTLGIQALTIEPNSELSSDDYTYVPTVDEEVTQNISALNKNNNNLRLTKTSNLNIKKVNNSENNGQYISYYKPGTLNGDRLYGDYVEDSNWKGVPIPSGYNYSEINGVVKITSKKNENLQFIWVPIKKKYLDDKPGYRSELSKKFCEIVKKDYSKESNEKNYIADTFQGNIGGTNDDQISKMIDFYGGFYMGVNETSYDKNDRVCTIPRGHATVNGELSVKNDGLGKDYIRIDDYDNGKSKKVENLLKDINGYQQDYTYDYFTLFEYEALWLWIYETNSFYEDKAGNGMLKVMNIDSSYIGKYKGTYEMDNDYWHFESFNGFYGLAGCLSEFVKTKYQNSSTSIGGAYKYLGSETPMTHLHYDTNGEHVRSKNWINLRYRSSREKTRKWPYGV